MRIIKNDEIMEAAREVGEALANCEECRAVEKAQEALVRDEGAKKLLDAYQSVQRSIQMAEMWGGRRRPKDELDELKRLEAKMENNRIIKSLLDAQMNLQEMLANLNAEISGLLGIDFASNSSSGCC